MSHGEKAVGLLDRLGKAMGMETLEFDDDGACVLCLDETILIHIECPPEGETLVVSAYLGALPETNRESAYRTLLAGNFGWNATGGATIGLDETSDTLALMRMLSVEQTDDETFQSCIRSMASAAETWIAYLKDGGNEPVAASAATKGMRV